MKKYINRNYFWADLFVGQLAKLGVKHVCISPGSRNTSLTLAFADNNKFKKYIHIDERSSGFFALGIAKSVKQPVVLVTTSGTAVAELYPAIIEAYLQRIPLIVCTADRPKYLKNTGANQTIDQDNIFKNHIRYFNDFGLPSLNENKLNSLCKIACEAITIASTINPGPIHFNFPFKKPFEPKSFTDDINYKLPDFIKIPSIRQSGNLGKGKINELIKSIEKSKRPLIHIGWDNYDSEFCDSIVNFASANKIPLLVDGTSELRFFKGKNKNIITNHSAFLKHLKGGSDLIIQFGNAPTSQSMLKYIEKSRAKRFLINKYGDVKDPSRQKGQLIRIDGNELLGKLNQLKFPTNQKKIWYKEILVADKSCENVKLEILNKLKFGSEPRIVNEILNSIPNNSNLFISNSLPIRDFDFFASKQKSRIKIFTNRGASGIDGIISTASGIASESKAKTFLIIGDLAFYHNISALSTLHELKILLTIILVNNNGGGLFNMLPIAENNNFEKYFNTSQNLNYFKLVKAFGGNYSSPKSWKKLSEIIEKTKNQNSFTVIEIETESKKSLQMRKEYWANISSLFK